MRYHELKNARHVGIADAPIRPVKLPRVEEKNTTSKPTRYPRFVRLIIRLMPAVYRDLDLGITHGDPDAYIDINEAWISFPEPYDTVGDLSEDCRKWIIEMVRDAAMELGLGFCILFDDGPIYVRTDGDLVIGGRAPEGGLRL